MTKNYILSIDQGTTSTRAILFCHDEDGFHPVGHREQYDLKQHYPHSGWVEHNPEQIWRDTLKTCQKTINQDALGVSSKDILGIGISNQRETTVLWNKKTGKPLYNAIVWQDRRTAEFCLKMQKQGHEPMITDKTGLLLDPYFSATKIAWILDNVEGARELAEQGDVLFGTIDCYLLWKLTGGRVHATDVTNAARTLLFNIKTQQWDKELLTFFNIPESLLPKVLDNCADFGETAPEHFGVPIKIAAMAGDQQAATFGQACFKPGMVKSTYGTGCFVLMNTGDKLVKSKNRLLSTIAYRLNGEVTYGIEGSVFIAGAAIQWLRDMVHMIKSPGETQHLAEQVEDTGGVYLVPAFTGLGAPYWDPEARGALLGLTRDTGVKQIARAALEAVCYQTRDLMEAIENDSSIRTEALRVDGGMAANQWLLQFLSDILDIQIQRPSCVEISALGVAYMAGLQVGILGGVEDVVDLWHASTEFEPQMGSERRKSLYSGWLKAVKRICTR